MQILAWGIHSTDWQARFQAHLLAWHRCDTFILPFLWNLSTIFCLCNGGTAQSVVSCRLTKRCYFHVESDTYSGQSIKIVWKPEEVFSLWLWDFQNCVALIIVMDNVTVAGSMLAVIIHALLMFLRLRIDWYECTRIDRLYAIIYSNHRGF